MSQRMQWSEAEAVVRAYRAERGSTSVDVETLARALNTDVAEVRRLASRRPRFVDGSGVLSAGLAFAVAVAAFMLAGSSFFSHNPLLARIQPPAPPVIEAPAEPAVAFYPASGDRVIHMRVYRATDEPPM